MTEKYTWIDNPTVSGVSQYNPDILNDCLMHLKYNNSQFVTPFFSVNKGNIDENGNADLIDCDITTNLSFSQPGSYSVDIPIDGNYDVVLVGGGAGGACGMNVYAINSSSSGGSGAAFVGNIFIPAGSYNVTVGSGGDSAGNGGSAGAGGTTSIDNLISASGGSAGAYATWGNFVQSFGGVVTTNTTVNSYSVNSSGNNGCTAFNDNASGGASVYGGFGKGGDAYKTGANKGGNGYLSINLSGSNNIGYKIGGSFSNLYCTDLYGEKFEISGLNSDNANELADGTYTKFVAPDGSSVLLKNHVFIQNYTPTADINDVWINTSFYPFNVLQFNGLTWVPFNKIPLGEITIENSLVSHARTFPYNIYSTCIVDSFINGDSGYILYSDGLCRQWGSLLVVSNSSEITLLKPFKTNEYNIQLSNGMTASSIYYLNKTNSSFSVYSSALGSISWSAIGYQ